MKIITIHQPESFPWLGFFNKMMLADEYVILDNVQFRKNYFQNRNKILTKHGPIYLTIPITIKNSKLIKDIIINNKTNWKEKHLKTIIQTYKKSPYFHQHIDFFEELYKKDFKKLVDFNLEIISYIRNILNIKNKLIKASQLEVEGKSSELLLNICKKLKADIYISGTDGRNYLDTKLFENNDIKVVYHNFNHPIYKQFNSKEFIPYMSTIDLLFNYSNEEAKNIIKSGGRFCEE